VELFDIFHLEAMRAFFSLSQNLSDPAVLRRIAHEAGADLALFDQDIVDPRLHDLVWQEFTGGVERDRVIAIATMFIGRQHVVDGALSLDHYRQAFDTVFAAHERLV
jgi:predicted DsbA family dithiol-disulfide isomerase